MIVMDIPSSVARAKENISRAAAACGRSSDDIILVAATKMNSADRVQQAISSGISVCGENRVQEMLEKNAQGAYKGAALHFIGHLQKNKAKQVVGLAELIHSVDSLELLACIDKVASAKGLIQDVLLEVNIGEEPSKSGFQARQIPEILAQAGDFSSVRIRGLMAIPPICSSQAEILPYFQLMKQLFVDNGAKKYDNVFMDFLSMGMSGDYECAIACGANMIRLGSAIFGPRNYQQK